MNYYINPPIRLEAKPGSGGIFFSQKKIVRKPGSNMVEKINNPPKQITFLPGQISDSPGQISNAPVDGRPYLPTSPRGRWVSREGKVTVYYSASGGGEFAQFHSSHFLMPHLSMRWGSGLLTGELNSTVLEVGERWGKNNCSVPAFCPWSLLRFNGVII